MKIAFTLNQKALEVDVPPTASLRDVLIHEAHCFSLTQGCGEKQCGSCLVLLEEKPLYGCSLPIASVIKKRVVTIEGIIKSKIYDAILNEYEKRELTFCNGCFPAQTLALYHFFNHNNENSWQKMPLYVTCPYGCVPEREILNLTASLSQGDPK